MNRLIKNEFKKLFSKKLMYILLIITIGAVILTKVLYSIDVVNMAEKQYLESQLTYLEEEMKKSEYKLPENKETLISLQVEYEKIKLELNYDMDSWQYDYIDREETVYDLIRNVKQSEAENDKTALEKANKEYNEIKQKLESGDWQSIAKEQLEELNTKINDAEKLSKEVKDIISSQEINIELENMKISKQGLEWRLEKNIPFDNSFSSLKIIDYVNSSQYINGIKYKENKTREEQLNYDESLKNANIDKYYIENNIVIEKDNNAGDTLANIMNEYGMFIIIFSIIVAGTIVSNESQKGTIKLLLTRPYTRNKILVSKYIVSVLSIFLFIAVFMITEFIVGGIAEGFDIFKIPMVDYNIKTNSIVVMSVFKYSIIKTLMILPVVLLLSTLGFAFSTITSNSAVSVAMPILGYMGSNIINYFIDRVKILKYFVTANWDLSIYMFGGKGLADGLNFTSSLIICIIYLVVMIITTFIVFNKRDIKNV